MEWIRKQRAVYLGNAGAVKDYRVQFRGNRAAWFWLLYLVLLAFFAIATYSTTQIGGKQSISVIQGQLYGFYLVIMQTVQTVVLVAAPILASQGVVSEFERQSYELVMSAPVTPKYFLVGKLTSGFRTLVMILVLSVPISSLGVIMGGATWADVFDAYGHILLQGTILMAFSLPLCMMTKKMVSTVFYTYGFIGVLGLGAALTGSTTMMMRSYMGGGTSTIDTVPFFSGLLPYLPTMMPSHKTTVMGTAVPNIVLAAIFTLALIKLMLLAAGSVMSRENSAETKSLRIHGLVFGFVLGLLAVMTIPGEMIEGMGGTHPWKGAGLAGALGGSSGIGSEYAMPIMAGLVGLMVLIVIPMLPYLSAFSFNDGRRHQATGWFQPRKILLSEGGGGLPYVLALVTAIFAPLIWLFAVSGVSADVVIAGVGWVYAFCALGWSLTWWASSLGSSVSAGRRGGFGLILGVMILPTIFLTLMQTATLYSSGPVWVEYTPFQPYSSDSMTGIFKIGLLVVLTLVITASAENRRIKKAKLAGVIS